MGTRKRHYIKEESQAFYGRDELILLDTHIWIWYVSKEIRQIPSAAHAKIVKAEIAGLLRICYFSIWEIGLLEQKGRIHLAMDSLEWVKNAMEQTNASLAPLTPEIIIKSTRLPGNLHADPTDRILVATARNIDATLMTRDERIIQYGRQGYVKIFSS
ncbi:MAG: type II toxin-antitoxin system VapC family toxin [Candidatus Omnitrophica bacterium]|nr:type II toxin-antitoxin system VapC family toxin [Candidatus Omnitrophota bacterium]